MTILSYLVSTVSLIVQLTAGTQSNDAIEQCARAPENLVRTACAKAFEWVRDSGTDVPYSEALHGRLIEGALALGDVEGALRMCRAGMRRFPKSVQFYRQLGTILLDSQDAAFEAYGPLLEAVRLDPKDGTARQRLGDALMSMRRHEEAVSTYRAAEGLLGPSWDLSIGKAQALRALGRLDEALDVLNRARAWESSRPGGALSAQMRGDLLLESGRVEEAAREFRALLSTDLSVDERGAALCGLARAMERLRPGAEAARACDEAAKASQHRRGKPCACTK
jgi:tetratricopeptide (TPR) repeat protein